MVVLKVSTGIKRIRNPAAPTEAATVFRPTGRLAVNSKASKAASVPVFAAVSPNLERGP